METDISESFLPVYESLASSTRLKIINFLRDEKKSVSDIAKFLGISKAITTRHIQKMEDAGLLDSERGTGENRNKKMVFLKVDNIHIAFPEKIYRSYEVYSTDLKLGHFTNFEVSPTCGIATIDNVIGKADDPKFFMDSERMNASLLWFSKGYVEYTIPNFIKDTQNPKLLEISFELASEFPVSNNSWPSDITLYINNLKVAVLSIPGNFSDVRGIFTPSWWRDEFSQYGLLKHVRINEIDTGVEGEKCSDITVDDLNLHSSPFIKIRFSIDDDAKNKGGLTLFGKGFGNHDQNILVNTYYTNK